MTNDLHVGESSFEGWYARYNPAGKGDKQRARDADDASGVLASHEPKENDRG